MNKVIVKGISAVLGIAVVGLVAGLVTRRTFVDNTDLETFVSADPIVEYCDMNYAEDASLGLVDGYSVESVGDLMADGETVVKVYLKDTWHRELYQECVLSQVEVKQVYQGDVKPGDDILVFEPVTCGGNFMDCTDGYTLMQEGQEYVLFLKRLKNAGYGDDEYVYIPGCLTYGKFTYSDSVPPEYIDYLEEDPHFKYSEVRDAEIIAMDKEQYDKYCRLKKVVYDMMN